MGRFLTISLLVVLGAIWPTPFTIFAIFTLPCAVGLLLAIAFPNYISEKAVDMGLLIHLRGFIRYFTFMAVFTDVTDLKFGG